MVRPSAWLFQMRGNVHTMQNNYPTDCKFPTGKKMDKHVAGQYRKSNIDKSRNNLGLDEE